MGIGEVGGGSHERPEAKSLVKAEATARDGGLGGAGVAEKKYIFHFAGVAENKYIFHFDMTTIIIFFDKIR